MLEKRWLTASFLSLLIPSILFPSAWGREPGKFIFIHSFTREVSTSNFDKNGSTSATGNYTKIDLTNYGELGVSQKVTTGYRISAQTNILSVNGAERVNTRLSDADLFSRFSLWSADRSAAAIQVLARVPIMARTSQAPEVQDDQLHAEFKFAYGYNRWDAFIPVFFELEPGIRFKVGGLSPQLVLDVTTGFTLGQDWLLMVKGFHFSPLRSNLTADDFGRTDLQPSLVWHAGNITSFQVGATKRLSGKNVNNGFSTFLAVWATWSPF